MTTITQDLIEIHEMVSRISGHPDVKAWLIEDGMALGFNANGFPVIQMPEEDFEALLNNNIDTK